MGEFNPNADPKSEQQRQLEQEVRQRKPIDQIFKIFDQRETPLTTKLQDNTWMAIYNQPTNTINLGIKPIPESIKNDRFYLSENFSNQDILVHRYLHELSHSIDFNIVKFNFIGTSSDVSNERQELAELFNKKNAENLYLSVYAGCGTSQIDADIEYEEFAELFAIRLYDKDYYNQYLKMLNNSHSFKNKLSLATLTEGELLTLDSNLEKIEQHILNIDPNNIEPKKEVKIIF